MAPPCHRLALQADTPLLRYQSKVVNFMATTHADSAMTYLSGAIDNALDSPNRARIKNLVVEGALGFEQTGRPSHRTVYHHYSPSDNVPLNPTSKRWISGM